MEENKCRDCKWLTGKRTSHGYECMNPEKQAIWNERLTLWMGELRMPNARYKHPVAKACKRFESAN